VAASGSPFGLGADIGGSIRYPSAFNGVPGHKPTSNLVPGTGHWPPAEGPLAAYNSYGPLCRKVCDLAYILPIIAGPDGKDKSVAMRRFIPPESVDVSRLRVYYFDYNGQSRPDRDVVRAVSLAAGAFQGLKIPVEPWRPEGVENSLEIWQAAMAQNPEPFRRFLEGEEPLNLGREFLRLLLRRSRITFPALGAAIIEKPGQLLAGRNRRFLALAENLQQRIEDRLGENGVLLCPVFPTPAPRHGVIWFNIFGVGYSGLINVLQFPATIIPIFHRKDGLPVSLQIIAGRWKDHLTLAAAGILEQIFGGWKPIARLKN
jgi:fatty acid amide hydrolase 2